MERPSPANDFQSTHAERLLSSFKLFVGRSLMDEGPTAAESARLLFQAPFVVASHGGGADPILSYGNEAALTLWDADWDTFTGMPSRLTAEPVHRDERARLLQATEEKGYIDHYSGIRISATGRRFRIENAIVWTVVDSDGERIGQAATFVTVQFL
jgi:hypothetical protein